MVYLEILGAYFKISIMQRIEWFILNCMLSLVKGMYIIQAFKGEILKQFDRKFLYLNLYLHSSKTFSVAFWVAHKWMITQRQ